MEPIAPDQVARIVVVAFGVFTATLALFAWRMSLHPRSWRATIAVSTVAYAICTASQLETAALPVALVLVFER